MMQDVRERKLQLQEMEEKAARAALVEERSRFCQLVSLLQPVVESEVAMLAEVGHLQEGQEQLLKHVTEPRTLPPASLQVITDTKCGGGGSLGCDTAPHSPAPCRLSRKSSVCSISSLDSDSSQRQERGLSPNVSCSTPLSNASSGDTLPLHNSNNSQERAESRIRSVCSSDSGFRSTDALHLPPLPGGFFSKLRLYGERKRHNEGSDNHSVCSGSTTPAGNQDADLAGNVDCTDTNSNGVSSTWPDLKDTAQFERAASAIMGGRPHTISAGYEKVHGRPALSVHTFQPNETSQPIYAATRPPLPTRCSSLERPSVPAKSVHQRIEHKAVKPSSLPPHLTKEISQALYVNMSELATLAAGRAQHDHHEKQPQQEKVCSESSASESSLESSSGYGSQTAFAADDPHHAMSVHQPECEVVTLRRDCRAPPDAYSVSLGSLEEAVRCLDEFANRQYATIKPALPSKRPLSMTATCGRAGGAGSRRGSTASAGAKPPPPARRSSSISRQQPGPYSHYQESGSTNQQSDADNLPPPPAFLLQPDSDNQLSNSTINVAETIKQLTELKHTPASPSVMRRNAEQTPCNQPQLSTFRAGQPAGQQGYHAGGFHQGAHQKPPNLNPIYGQTGHRIMTYIEQNAIYGRKSSTNSINSDIYRSAERGRESGGATAAATEERKGVIYAQPSQIIASFNSMSLRSETGSPLPQRRDTRQPRRNSDKDMSKLQGQVDFLDKLSATLQNQRRRLDSHKASDVRTVINSAAQPDPRSSHSSLMEQIKRGATLRRNKNCNDRSAPNLR